MIEVCAGENDNYFVTMGCRSPSVYLDHWAVVKIARNQEWQERFINALKKKRGTLLFSILNIIELGRKTDELTEIGQLLEQIGTNWYLIDVNAPAVIEREHADLPSSKPPNFDEKALQSYYPYIHGEALTLRKITQLVVGQKHRYDNIYDKLEPLATRLTETREALLRRDPGINADAYKPGTFDPLRPTAYVYHTLMWKMLHSDINITKNHICDLQHATAALSYGDFVLLDKHWCQLARNNLTALMNINRRVSSEKDMESFLHIFESVELDEK